MRRITIGSRTHIIAASATRFLVSTPHDGNTLLVMAMFLRWHLLHRLPYKEDSRNGGNMRKLNRMFAGASVLGLSMALLFSSPASAGVTAVTKISGSRTCPINQTVRVQALANSGTITISINGIVKQTQTFAINYNTGMRTASWSVSGSDLATASDYCADR